MGYRSNLGKDQERILLVMDGHGTHTVQESVGYCAANRIDLCFLPPHTSHILQPLDVGIFAAYKAAYRRAGSESAIDDVEITWTSVATKNRCRMLARALIANMNSVTTFKVSRAFLNTGIYPVSIDRFLAKCSGVRNVPPEVRLRAKEAVAKEKADREERARNRPRRNVRDELVLVDSSFEL